MRSEPWADDCVGSGDSSSAKLSVTSRVVASDMETQKKRLHAEIGYPFFKIQRKR